MERFLNGQRIKRHVKCESCGKHSDRVMNEAGHFGVCVLCGGKMSPGVLLADKRRKKAKDELAEMDPDRQKGKR
jgi:hypothetical protein